MDTPDPWSFEEQTMTGGSMSNTERRTIEKKAKRFKQLRSMGYKTKGSWAHHTPTGHRVHIGPSHFTREHKGPTPAGLRAAIENLKKARAAKGRGFKSMRKTGRTK